jgi:hypothetical protein
VINHRNEYRLVFEPFRAERVRSARGFRVGQYIDPERQDHPLGSTTDRLLAGRVRSWWTDDQNRRRLARRRIVKEIRITNLVPWIRARHPELPIVYAYRDPVAVARSWLELGWGSRVEELAAEEELLDRLGVDARTVQALAGGGDEFERTVLRWCLENALLLTSEVANLHRVAYERLRTRPEEELTRLFRYLGSADPPAEAAVASAAAERPSATSGFPRHARVVPTDEQVRRAHELAALFGIGL